MAKKLVFKGYPGIPDSNWDDWTPEQIKSFKEQQPAAHEQLMLLVREHEKANAPAKAESAPAPKADAPKAAGAAVAAPTGTGGATPQGGTNGN